MNIEERKLRSRIRKKCKIYIYELALAQLCGLVPDKKMKKLGIDDISKAIEYVSRQSVRGWGKETIPLPLPLNRYIYLIKNRESPYYEIAEFVFKELERRYRKAGHEIVCTIDKEFILALLEKCENKIKNDEKRLKLTMINARRTILALLFGSHLKESDFYFTKTRKGRINYHIRVNLHNLNLISNFIGQYFF